jgi:flagellar biogenesis protein FliO
MLAFLLALAAAASEPAPAPAAAPALAAPAPAAPAPVAPALSAGMLAPALVLLALGGAALLLSRRRTRRDRLVEVLETSSLGPRRSLVVARMGGELLVLGVSEGGVSLLTTAPAAAVARAPAVAPGTRPEGRGEGLLARLRLVPQRAPAPVFDSLLAESLEDAELRRKLAAGQVGSVR